MCIIDAQDQDLDLAFLQVQQKISFFCGTRANIHGIESSTCWFVFTSVQYIYGQHDVHLSILSRHVAPPLPVSSTPLRPLLSFHSSGRSVQVLVVAIMCIQTIGICPYSHREHMGLHWCSLLISRGQWNLFECSAFEALEIESPQWSCQTCLEQSAGRKTYLDTSFRLDLWRSFFRRLRPWKPRARKCAAWEMQLV